MKDLYATLWNDFQKEDIAKYLNWYKTHTRLFLLIAKHLNIKTVLDCGCGAGYETEFFKEKGFETTGYDLNINQARKRGLKCIQGDITNIKLKENSFDAVISLGVIHHIDAEKAIKNLCKTSRKIVFVGIYGNKGFFFKTTETAVRKSLSILPYNFYKKLFAFLNYSPYSSSIRLDWIFASKTKRIPIEGLIKMFDKDWFCVIEKIGNWTNCIAIKKEAL